MAPIPVYSASPINTATETPTPTDKNQDKTKTTATAGPGLEGRQHAQPGAAPTLPTATGVPQPAPAAAIPSRVLPASPPAPQPGAAPPPPGLPPPPKAGEAAAAAAVAVAAKQNSQAPAQTSTPPQMPPQLSYQAPTVAQPFQGRSSTTADPHGYMGGRGPYPAPVHGTGVNSSSAGYINQASGYPHQQSLSGPQNSITTSSAELDDQSPGMWDTARKWASAAGESLAAAESEVWKRINKN
ncbi:hypothetical protein L249_6654 [Ophiocordyceps polyrhachis-furcata BCC 54312]|uniref:Uncharacterized protein n=1 Tax=Ophiocordyceps polyrhachis-furcata BCC 54312 TaxID=1330021 RepID=A0A367LKZ0_9HYPO|nr:hypothetical protein L249_6654 [Ophiocordyceps polyrhachis-furcata BCC 54312]